MKDLVIAPKEPQPRKNRRDVERTIEHWSRHGSGDGGVPLLPAFDFASIKGDWSHRFLICTDQNVESAAFLAYGTKFARLLDLPETVRAIVPLNQQIPERYRPLFSEGSSNALTKQEPARVSGSFEHDFTAELFRAVFLPIQMHRSWSKWLVFGSFNYRTVLSVDRQAP
jgi:hypothetical protein